MKPMGKYIDPDRLKTQYVSGKTLQKLMKFEIQMMGLFFCKTFVAKKWSEHKTMKINSSTTSVALAAIFEP